MTTPTGSAVNILLEDFKKARYIFKTWHKGCGNTIPFRETPWMCEECTRGMVGALAVALRLDQTNLDTIYGLAPGSFAHGLYAAHDQKTQKTEPGEIRP